MLNLTTSFVNTFVSIVLSFLSFLKGPMLLILGVIAVVFLLAPPVEAAVIQCNVSGCPPISWWGAMPIHDKAAVILFFSGLIVGNFLMWHDRKVTAARIKKEEKEWLKKYHS